MKSFLILAILAISLVFLIAQKFEDFEDIKLKTEEDYVNSEPQVLEACDYILDSRIGDQSASRLNAMIFMIRWSTGAPYDFVIAEWGMNLLKKESDFLVIQLASLVKFKLENKDADEADVQLGAATLVYKYIKNPKSFVKIKGYIKKFVAAGDAGTLQSFISN